VIAPAWRRRLDAWVGGLVAVLMAVALLVVLWQVASRYLVRAPSSFTEELVRFLLIWIAIVGGAYAAGQNQHMACDFVPDRWPARRRAAVACLVQALIGIFGAVVLLYGGGRLVALQQELGQRSAALDLPLWAVYLALPLGGLILVLYAALQAREFWLAARAAADTP
jgi:TRAP-type C4-dicarboxylate transport system permease small subunit